MPDTQLLSLQVENLGPIASAHLDFTEGLNVLTGETGAGKTLLVGALSLCAGYSDERGLRHDGPLAVSSVFATGEREVSLSRRDDGSSRLRSYLDGTLTSATGLRDAADSLLSIYGQAASQRLRSGTEALRLVDQHGSIDATALARARRELADATRELAELGGDAATRDREIAYLRTRLAEVDTVAPTSATELDEVIEQIKNLELVRAHHEAIAQAAALLDADDGAAAAPLLSEAIRRLPDEGEFSSLLARLRAAHAEVADVAHSLAARRYAAAPDESELAQLDARATDLHRLARSFGGSLAAALADAATMRDDLDRLEASTSRSGDLETRIRDLDITVAEENRRLRAARESAAQAFTAAVSSHFASVALPRAELSASVEGDDGSAITLLFSPDGRRAPGPLPQLASGGELARVMLAISLESVSADVVAVFDEVDAGIGGTVAERIGECLRTLARRQQVIVVTHLASVAALADRHFVVDGATGERPAATVREVTGEDRVHEVARMLAGFSAPAASRALAEQLLAGSQL